MVHKSQDRKEKEKKFVLKEKIRSDKLKILEQALREKIKEAEENKVLAQRIKAEFDNYRKRVLRDYDENIKVANESLIRRLLAIVDPIERALIIKRIEDERFRSFYDGTELIYKRFSDILSEFGLKVICPEKKEAFNPAVHEAIMVQETGEEDDVVLEVLDKGYMISDKLLRAAKVKVGRSAKGKE